MKAFTRFSLYLPVIACTLFAAAAAAPPNKDVNVVNTPSVNVANSPDVNVVNTANVNVANTPGVNVTNDPGVHVLSQPPVTIDSDARQPFHTSVSTTDWTTNAVNMIVEVPSGNRLVIEYVSASAFMHPQVELGSVAIFPHANGTSAAHVIPMSETAPGFSGSNTYSGGQSLRLYTDQSFLARFSKVSVGGSLDLGTASIAVSGYLIPFTSPSLAP